MCFQLLIKHTWNPLDEQVIWLLLDVLLVYKDIFRAWDQSSKADFKTVVLIMLRPGTLGKQLGENESNVNYTEVTSSHHYSKLTIQTTDWCWQRYKKQTKTRNKQKKKKIPCYSLKVDMHYVSYSAYMYVKGLHYHSSINSCI